MPAWVDNDRFDIAARAPGNGDLERLEAVAGRDNIRAESFEHHAHRFARIIHVLDDEDAETVQRQLVRGRPERRPILRNGGQRPTQGHLRAAARSVTGKNCVQPAEAQGPHRFPAPRPRVAVGPCSFCSTPSHAENAACRAKPVA